MDPTELLGHAGWLRALATRLLRDSHGAEDVAQTTLMRALERPPRCGVPLAAWLAHVARNVVRQRLRARERRVRHESKAAAARVSGLDSACRPDETAERAEAFRRLVEAIRALDEPYRAVIVLVYFDGLSTAEAARRLGVPVETARTRKKRALALLRRRLGDDEEQRRAVLVLIVGSGASGGKIGAARQTAPTSWVATGGAIMGNIIGKATLAALVGLAVVVGVVLARPHDRPDRVVGAPADSPQRSVRRARVAMAAAEEPASGDTEPASSRSMTVHVLDAVTGEPVEGALLVAEAAGPQTAVCDERGSARLELETDVVTSICAVAPGYRSAVTRTAPATDDDIVSVRLWPLWLEQNTKTITGVVTDPAGHPVPGVTVVAGVEEPAQAAISGDDGRFVMECSYTWGLILRARHPVLGEGIATANWEIAASGYSRPPDVEIRLGVEHALPVHIRMPAAGGFRGLLVSTPDHPWRAGAEPRATAVSDGDLAVLPAGVWRVELRSDDGATLLARPHLVTVDLDGVHAGVWRRPPSGSAPGDPLKSLDFTIATREFAFRVTDGADPVADARIAVQDAAAADARGWTYEEMPDSRALRPGGISAAIGRPRRAEEHLRRSVETGPDGRAVLRGWVPLPAMVSVEGDHIVPAYRVVAAVEADGGEVALTVARGAAVEVVLPGHLQSCVLERTDVPHLELLDHERPAAVVAPGTYRVRLMRPPGRSADSVVIVAPFAPAAGETRSFDLSDVAPRVADVLALTRLDPGVHAFATSVWNADENRPWHELRDGRVAFDVIAAVGPRRYCVSWSDEAATHHHEVQFDGDEACRGGTWPRGAAAGPPPESLHSLDYDAGTLELTVEGLRPGAVLTLCAADCAAPYAHRHQVTIDADRAARGAVVVRDLPAGEYTPYVGGATYLTCNPVKIVVEARATHRETITVADLRCRARVHGYDPSMAGWILMPVQLRPADAESLRDTISAAWWEPPCATFRRVPDGVYRVRVLGPGEAEIQNGVAYCRSRVLHEETVTIGPASRDIEIDVHR